MKLIREMIKRRHWKRKDLKCSPGEQAILHNWHLSLADNPTSTADISRLNSPTTWTPPPIGFIKNNFDGASKGNSGPASFRAVLRNSNGEIIHLTTGFLGSNTNNVAELWSLLRGIKVAT
jgi:hypothetical protein